MGRFSYKLKVNRVQSDGGVLVTRKGRAQLAHYCTVKTIQGDGDSVMVREKC